MIPHLIVNEVKLHIYEMRQYWFESVTGIIFMTLVFLGLFYGIKSFVIEQDDNQSLNGLLFGYILWAFASSAYSSVTQTIVEDTQKGYLEQLFLCPQGFVTFMLCRAFVDSLIGLLTVILLAYIAMAITGNWVDINFAIMSATLLLTAPSLVGFGLIMSGLALVFKRIETVSALLSIGLMGLVAIDGLPLNAFSFLPFVPGASLARDLVLEQAPVIWSHVFIVALNSLVYLACGVFAFKFFERQAKLKNLIGQY